MTGQPIAGGRRIAALVLLAGVFVMEGYDIAAMGLAVPRLHEPLGLAPTSFGWVFSALLIGLGLGGALIAPLGDRFGRRPLIAFGCLAVAAATLATATATSIPAFLLWRFVAGVGFGACLPNVSALSAEIAPARMRATIMAVVSAGIPLGIALAGIFAPEVVAAAGWQGLFLVPGLLAAVLAAALGYLLQPGPPESTGAAATRSSRLPQLDLIRGVWLLPFAVFAAILSLNAMNLYYFNSWLPTVLPLADFTIDEAARVSGVVQLAGIAIGVAASLGIDRWRPGPTLLLMFGAMAVCFAAIGLTAPDPLRWRLLLMVGVGGASAGGMALPALCAYLFPPRLLSSAVGLGVLVARLGAIAGPPVGEAMLDGGASAQTFIVFGAVPAALCALVCLMLPAALKVRPRQEGAAA
ncbi:MAG TPA: MFS transporter [Croceibacterium sp.]|nr:MFS transporter [Croceibacterium sp.]